MMVEQISRAANCSDPLHQMDSACNSTALTAPPTLSPYLENLSWIEPASDRNVSLYIDKDFTLCDWFHSYCHLRVMVDVFAVVPICLTGFIGNTLAFLVLKWDSLNVAVSMQLQALALIDNFYLVCCLFYQTLKTVADCTSWSYWLTRHFGFIEVYMWPIASVGHTATVWMVTAITIDRYYAIRRPFNNKILGSPGRVRKAVLLVLAAALIYNIPRFLEKQALFKPYFCTQSMRNVALPRAFRANKLYYILYKTTCYFLFRILLPFSILIVLNTSLIQSVHSIYKEHTALTQNRPSNGAQRNDHYTIVLVSMVTVFITCEIPDVTIRVISMLRQYGWIKVDVTVVNTASVFTNLLLTINSSVNCIVYCLVARRFRKILQRHICRSRCSEGSIITKKSFSSMNSHDIRPETSEELLRYATSDGAYGTDRTSARNGRMMGDGKGKAMLMKPLHGSHTNRKACQV